jgi:serine/threonine protein kinase
VIGIDRYRAWRTLHNAVGDARGALAAFEKLGFQRAVEPLLDEAATCAALRDLVTDGLRALDPNDSLVLFFAGHGHTETTTYAAGNPSKQGYIIPVDAAKSRVATWLRVDHWLSDVARLPPQHILVILDACHSGIALDRVAGWRSGGRRLDEPIEQLRRRRSRRVFTSALDGEYAMDSGPRHGYSLFTGYLIEALDGGLARTSKRQATGSQIWEHVRSHVTAFPGAMQTPDFGAFELDDRGELVVELPSFRTTQRGHAMSAPPLDSAGGGAEPSAAPASGSPTTVHMACKCGKGQLAVSTSDFFEPCKHPVRAGDYEFTEFLGSGGNAAVFIGKNMYREAAIKIPHPTGLLNRILPEARLLNGLKHERIPTLYQVGHLSDGRLYMAMEVIRGKSLHEYVQAEQASSVEAIDRCISLTRDLLRIIEFLHDRSVVHCDIKPDNTLIAFEMNEWRLWLIDFGISGIAQQAPAQHGVRAGTPGFAAPEQLRDQEGWNRDPRVDLHAIGAVLYFQLTGGKVPYMEHVPPEGSPPSEYLAFLDKLEGGLRPRPIETWNGDVPPELSSLVERAMAFLPGERFQSAREMRDELEGISTGEQARLDMELRRLMDWTWKDLLPARAYYLASACSRRPKDRLAPWQQHVRRLVEAIRIDLRTQSEVAVATRFARAMTELHTSASTSNGQTQP